MVAGNIISCLDAGACKVLSNTSYYVAIGTFIFCGILLVLIFLISFMTPGMVFLKAKITKNPVLYIVNRGQGGRFKVTKQKSEGVLDVAKVGPFIISENSHTREQKSGMPLFFAFGEFAGTLPLKWVYTVNKLKEQQSRKGEDIKNVEDLGKIFGKNYDNKEGTWD